MSHVEELDQLVRSFDPAEQETLRGQATQYNTFLRQLPEAAAFYDDLPLSDTGILALNGASGAGQSFVMDAVERVLKEKDLTLPRIYLLATRPPRPNEGDRDPYIFVEEFDGGYRDIYTPSATYSPADIYYFYQSRPGASNAILLSDMEEARKKKMYLETVVPTLLHIKTTAIGGLPAWGDLMRIVYLAAPDGFEWIFRLLQRQPEKLSDPSYRSQVLGRTGSSLSDMKLAAENTIPVVLNRWGKADQAAREIISAWGI
ncbi:MAG: hypothetical protein U9N73_02795 [Candidatus Auribacterota bacterium]|nr:hypothetical protein [Candidatus Auribacterota bacterium]